MIGKQDATSLLRDAERALTETLAPALTGELKYQALMIAAAIGMASRRQAQDGAAASAAEALANAAGQPAELVQRIRSGEWDMNVSLYSALLKSTVVATAISKPAVLSVAEQRLAEQD